MLTDVLITDALRLTEEGGRFVLRCSEFADVADGQIVRSRAREIAASLSGAVTVILGRSVTLAATGLAELRRDGTRNHFLEVQSARMVMRAMPVTLQVTHPDGSVTVARPGDPVLGWVKAADGAENVRRALRLISEAELGWVELYRIYEIILDDAGDRLFEWATKSAVNRFKRTANSVGAIGDLARHGRERGQPPPDPMSLGQARALIFDLVKTWLTRRESDIREGRAP
jgi:hypothetical protein